MLKSKIVKPLNGMNVAPFYGCHSQRPDEIFEARKGENVDQLDQLIHNFAERFLGRKLA